MQEKVSSKELFTICLFLSLFLLPGFGNTIIIDKANTSSIVTTFVGFLIGFIPVFLIIYIRKYLNTINIFELNNKFKVIGIFLNIILILFAIYLFFIGGWVVNNFVVSQYLTRTSYYIVALLNSFIISFAVIKGFEVISRSSIIMFAVFFIFALFAILFLLPISQIENIFPIFTIDLSNFSIASILYPCFACTPLIFLLVIKNSNITDNKFNKRFIISYIVGGIIAIIFIYLIISVFGPNISKMLSYPEYLLFRKIKAFNFIERVENVISITIFVIFYIGYAFTVFFVKRGVETTFNIKKESISNIIIVVLVFVLSFTSIYLFTHYNMQFLYNSFPYVSLVMQIFIVIITVIIFINKKKLIN